MLLEICNLNQSKASQDTDVPTKVIKINTDIFTDFICSFFPYILKLVQVTPVFKKEIMKIQRITIDQLVYY